MELQALEPERKRALEQRERFVAVPGMDARECLEPPGVGGARLGDELERARVHFGSVDDRHHDAELDSGLVHAAHGLGRFEIPAERREVVDVEVRVDDHAEAEAAASSKDWPGATSCHFAGFVNVRSTPPPSQL